MRQLDVFGTDVYLRQLQQYRALPVLPSSQYYRPRPVVLWAGSQLVWLEGKLLAGTTGRSPVLPGLAVSAHNGWIFGEPLYNLVFIIY